MSRLKSPFAFLGRSAAAEDDDKEDKNKSKSKAEEKDDDEDEDGKKKDKKDDDAKSKSKSKAESDDEDGDKKKKKDDEDDDKAKSKKAAKAEDDEDDTSASYKAGRAAGRSEERSRIRAILVSEAGQADPVAAAHVALDGDMPRDQAIGMLSAIQVSRAASGGSVRAGAGLGDRMGGVKNPDVGADGGSSSGPSMADRIIAAGKKARGEA